MTMDYDYIVKILKGESSPEDQKQLEIWLKDPEKQAQYEKIKKIWAVSGKMQASYKPNTTEAWSKIETHLSNGKDTKIRHLINYAWISKIAAIVLVAATAVFVVLQLNSGSNEKSRMVITTFSTENTIDSLILADGTKVWLNKNSSLSYVKSFDENERKVQLSGEAYFEVAKEKERPFIVEANHTITTVLGTSFNINSHKEETSIMVFTGKVAFSDLDHKESLLLEKGDQGKYTDHRLIKSTSNDPNHLAWKTGLLVFENTPMEIVVETLSNHYNQTVKIAEGLENLNLTASFYRQSLDEALEVMSITLDLKIHKSSNDYTLKP